MKSQLLENEAAVITTFGIFSLLYDPERVTPPLICGSLVSRPARVKLVLWRGNTFF